MPVHRLSGQPGAPEEEVSIRWDEYEDAGVPQPDVLQPETFDHMLEMCVGKQIARLIEFADGNPWDGASVGFEFRSHDRAFYWSRPCPSAFLAAGYCSVFVPQYMPPQRIITRSAEHRLTHDRIGSEITLNPLYERVEGSVIRSVRLVDEPNKWGGMTLAYELEGGKGLRLHALPGRAHGLASKWSANYKIEIDLPPKHSIVLPTFIGVR